MSLSSRASSSSATWALNALGSTFGIDRADATTLQLDGGLSTAQIEATSSALRKMSPNSVLRCAASSETCAQSCAECCSTFSTAARLCTEEPIRASAYRRAVWNIGCVITSSSLQDFRGAAERKALVRVTISSDLCVVLHDT